jgi:hypothetical protein
MKQLSIIAAAALTALSGLPVAARPQSDANKVLNQHRDLITSLQRSGVRVVINDPTVCSDRRIDGRYASLYRRLDICQDHAKRPYRMVAWTQNDLNTLRHEAHHVVQDCIDQKFDGQLRPVFDGNAYNTFVSNALTSDQIHGITSTYGNRGVRPKQIRTEVEAFAVAETIDADSIARKVDSFCRF